MTFSGLFLYRQSDFYKQREKVISLSDWICHLLKYKDDQFAHHSYFCYYTFNYLLCTQSKQHFNYICKKLNGKNIIFQNLKKWVQKRKVDLINHIVHSVKQLCRTWLFWAVRDCKLKVMILNLNVLHLFLTVSAADLQWFNLQTQMSEFKQHSGWTEHKQYRAASDNLTHNPHIAVKYLMCWFELFLKHIICKVFKVQDHWYCYEWQAHKSSHVHNFLWLDRASAVYAETDLHCETLTQWWGNWVTAVNLNFTLLSDKNSASLSITECSNTQLHLTECLNCYQHHKYSDSYCLQKLKNIEEKHCHFHFSQIFWTVITVSHDQNLKYYKYLTV